MSEVIVDLKNRDGDLPRFKEKKCLTVADLKRAIQIQRSLERKALNEYAAVSSFWLSRPMPKFCTPGLRM